MRCQQSSFTKSSVLYILYVKLKSSIFEFNEFSIGFFFQTEFRKLESYFSRLGDNDSEGKKTLQCQQFIAQLLEMDSE